MNLHEEMTEYFYIRLNTTCPMGSEVQGRKGGREGSEGKNEARKEGKEGRK